MHALSGSSIELSKPLKDGKGEERREGGTPKPGRKGKPDEIVSGDNGGSEKETKHKINIDKSCEGTNYYSDRGERGRGDKREVI